MRTSFKWLLTGLLVTVHACGSAPVEEAPVPDQIPVSISPYSRAGIATDGIYDDLGAYHRMGLIVSGPPISFAGNVAFFSTQSSDTTLVVISLSLPNRGLTFSHEKGWYEAVYGVTLILERDNKEVRRTDDVDTVRVDTPNEINRTDLKVSSFVVSLDFPPGRYFLNYSVRDGTVGRSAIENGELTVPRFTRMSFTRPVVVYDAPPRVLLTDVPQYVPKPRASFIFGTDKSAAVYLESYGTSITTPIVLALRNAEDSVIWRDTMWLAQRHGFAAGVVNVPLVKADVGVLMLSAVRPETVDTLWTPIFVQFSSGLPQLSFEEM